MQLSTIVAALPLFIASQHIAAYWPHDAEMDPLPLLKKAYDKGKHCYLPVLYPDPKQPLHQQTLGFVPYRPGDTLIPNRFGILEPCKTNGIINALALDLILLPLTAFDTQGNRLGMGGGYYDRTLALMKEEVQKPYLLGLAYEMQCVPKVPLDSWDIPLNSIVTEKRHYTLHD